jgi:hypothetical protein
MDSIAKKNLRRFESSLVLSVLFAGMVLLFLIVPAMADTGELGSETSYGYVSDTMIDAHYIGLTPHIRGIYFNTIENTPYPLSLLVQIPTAGGAFPVSNGNIGVDIYGGDTIVGTGILGWSLNSPGGYYDVFLYFNDDWNPGALTGNKYFNFSPLAPTQYAPCFVEPSGQSSHKHDSFFFEHPS